jgi:hypothetical protein
MTLGPEAVPIGRAAMAGVRAAERGAMAAGRAGERYAERVVPQVMERGGLPAQMISAMGQGTKSPMVVYHGSPYRFNRFDPTKIGTGEGAQAYGHGLYFAEAPGVAEDYRRTLAGNKLTFADDAARESATKLMPFGFEDPVAVMKGALGLNNDVVSAIKTLRGSYDKDPDLKAHANYLADLLESGAVRSDRAGHVYTVDLPDEKIARMLDWDKPLSEQSDFVKSAIKENELDYVPERLTGGRLLEEMNKAFEPGMVSKHLRDAGIPGIRYLDQGSRGAGQGTSNFVVFPGEEELLRILNVEGGLLAP